MKFEFNGHLKLMLCQNQVVDEQIFQKSLVN